MSLNYEYLFSQIDKAKKKKPKHYVPWNSPESKKLQAAAEAEKKEKEEEIESTGGRVLVQAPVSKILVNSNKAYGVLVKDTEIYADKIISAVGIRNTYWTLLPSVSLSIRQHFDDVFI